MTLLRTCDQSPERRLVARKPSVLHAPQRSAELRLVVAVVRNVIGEVVHASGPGRRGIALCGAPPEAGVAGGVEGSGDGVASRQGAETVPVRSVAAGGAVDLS